MMKFKKFLLRLCVKRLLSLQRIIFSIYLARDYSIKHYVYEKLLQEENVKVLDAFHHLRRHHVLLADDYQKLQACYDAFIEISTLRYRLKDVAVLEMCSQELLQISREIDTILTSFVSAKPVLEQHNLRENIFSLESIYQNALQVTLAEPLIFLIFIENLFSLEKQLEQMSQSHAFISA